MGLGLANDITMLFGPDPAPRSSAFGKTENELRSYRQVLFQVLYHPS